MANEFLTIASLAALAQRDLSEMIEQSLKFAPEVALLPSKIISGTTYTTVARTSLPRSKFRKLNEGVETGAAKYEERRAEMKYLDGQLEVDKAAAQKDSRGVGAFLDLELGGQVEAHIRYLGAQLWYGTGDGGDADGPLGAMDVVDDDLIVDATGSTADTGSSVWFINIAPNMLSLLFGNDQLLSRKPWREQKVVRNSKSLTAFCNAVEGWAGFNWNDKFAVGRIKNLTAQAGKGLTSSLGYELWAKFPSGRKPTHAVMSKRSREQYRQSLVTDLNPEPALPNSFCGLPIVETESILDTEAIEA